MKTEAFDYELPREFIAQHPVAERASSRLLVLDRMSGRVEHRHFRDITGYFRPGDVLVLNDSRVIPARLPARKATGGRVDLLLVEELAGGEWSCLVEGVRKASVPATLFVEDVPVVVNGGQPLLDGSVSGRDERFRPDGPGRSHAASALHQARGERGQ